MADTNETSALETVSFSLSRDEMEAVQVLAELRGVSTDQVLRQAITTEKSIDDLVQEGSTFYMLGSDGSRVVKQLAFRQVVIALPEFLTPKLAQTLAVLDDASLPAAKLLIGTMANADRQRLRDAGAIEGGEPAADIGWTEITITDYGQQLIAKCALRYPMTEETLRQAQVELDQARAEYVANGGKLSDPKRGLFRTLGTRMLDAVTKRGGNSGLN